LFFLVVMPVVGLLEKPAKLPGSITESVLGPDEPLPLSVPKARQREQVL
jgi:ubiquinol-cytochrome c reductase cytochrome b subunit